MNEENNKSAFSIIWQDVKKHKTLYYKVLGITFVLSVFIAFSIPNYYKCTVMLAPELSGNNKSSSGIASLASRFGVNLGSNNNGVDAIVPTLYPDLMNSVTFKASLFSVKVQKEDDDTTMTYYDYLLNHQKKPWWYAAKEAVFSLFAAPEPVEGPVNPFKLTSEQSGVIEIMNEKVVCDVDDKTMIITIDVTDQDPLIAATMADSVQVHLQEFITDYRTRKAKNDLAYSQKLYKEAKERYEQARKRYASYSDANQRVFLESVMSQKTALENEMQLQYQAYTQVASQLMAAEAKVQEETPAFTLLQPATVPLKKSGPNRKNAFFAYMLLALIATTVYVVYREHHIKTMIGALRKKNSNEMFDDDELYYLSRLLSGLEHNQSSKS